MFGMFKNAVAKLTGTPGQKQADRIDNGAPVDNDTLVQWAKDAINEKFDAQVEFTAWEITTAMRLAHPGYNISHTAVRPIVNHQLMAPIVNAGLYTVETRDFGGAIVANVYTPVIQGNTYAPA